MRNTRLGRAHLRCAKKKEKPWQSQGFVSLKRFVWQYNCINRRLNNRNK